MKMIGWLLSPSRMIFDKLKISCEDRTDFHKKWSKNFIYMELLLSVSLVVISISFKNINDYMLVYIPLCILAWSRINEVSYAFYCDAFSHLNNEEPSSMLSMPERAQMALRSYVGIIVYFALIYYFYWGECKFSTAPNNFFDSLYFSTISIATVGYGDIYPTNPVIKAFVMYEVLVGLLLVVIAIGTYIGGNSKNGEEV